MDGSRGSRLNYSAVPIRPYRAWGAVTRCIARYAPKLERWLVAMVISRCDR